MPLLKIFEDDYNGKTGIWKIKESPEELLEGLTLSKIESEEFTSIHLQKIKTEWLAVRLLLSKLEDKQQRTSLIKDNFGKPFFKSGSMMLSLSHSGSMAAAIIHPQSCGVDIQLLDKSLLKIAPRVLSSLELSLIPKKNALLHTGLFWSAKEALYKAYGKKKLLFKEEIVVDEFQQKNDMYFSSGKICRKGKIMDFQLTGYHIEDHVLINAVLKKQK